MTCPVGVVKVMKNRYSISNYDYELPKQLIRQTPPAIRSDCRLMILEKSELIHSQLPELTKILAKGDLIVLNKTKVRHSLVYAQKMTGGKLEINFLKKSGSGFTTLIKGKVKDGEVIDVAGKNLKVEIENNGFRRITGDIDWDYIERNGHLPLPPYIKERKDYQYYQNEIGVETGSVAAPTASLHFSKEMLESLTKKGVRVRYVLLEVGYGTYKEIRDDNIREHVVDEEEIEVGSDIVSEVENARGKLVAVGTTVMRALETSSYPGKMNPYKGSTRIFIYPGWKFNSRVTHLVTNFHIPRSSLLSLVYAFGGEERIKSAYREAIEKRYYFYSLGDAMLMDRYP